MSYSHLIPPEIEEHLLQVRGQGDNEFWTIGDVAVVLESGRDPFWAQAVRTAISDLAGVAVKQVGEYKSNALYYPPQVRSRYPTLTRYHFRFAKSAGKLSESLKWLDKAANSADEYGGYPMPVRVLQAQMSGNSETEDLCEWLEAKARQLRRKAEERGIPARVRDGLLLAADTLADAIPAGEAVTA